MDNLEQTLGGIVMAPYIVKAMALIGVRRRAGSNMFRHQISTMGILLDYKIVDSVLLKAAVIHDLFEDAAGLPGVTEDEITRIDGDGPAVYALVMEVTHVSVGPAKELKSEYLLRIMQSGSWRARVLKLADRISNITALGFVHDDAFVRRYLSETRTYILPYAEQVNRDMFRELSDLAANREQQLVGRAAQARSLLTSTDGAPMTHPQQRHPTETEDSKREDWQEPTDSGSGRPSKTTPSDLDDVDRDDPSRAGRKPNPTGLQA